MRRVPGDNDARLLEWELILPDAESVEQAGAQAPGRRSRADALGRMAFACPDPWGTTLLLRT